MISFFRKIRQKLLAENRVTRYLVYALGEILFVVIGILIALQINNANEAHKARQSERVVLKNLIQDLRAGSIGVKGMNREIKTPNLIRFMIYYNPIAINNDPSITSKISQEVIRKEITIYARYLKDLDDAYLQFSELVEKRIRVYLVEKKVHQLPHWFDNKAFKNKGEITVDFINFNSSFQNTGISTTDFGSIHQVHKHKIQYRKSSYTKPEAKRSNHQGIRKMSCSTSPKKLL